MSLSTVHVLSLHTNMYERTCIGNYSGIRFMSLLSTCMTKYTIPFEDTVRHEAKYLTATCMRWRHMMTNLVKLSGADVGKHVPQQSDLVLHVKVMQRSSLSCGSVRVTLTDHRSIHAVWRQRHHGLFLLETVQCVFPATTHSRSWKYKHYHVDNSNINLICYLWGLWAHTDHMPLLSVKNSAFSYRFSSSSRAFCSSQSATI